MIIFVAADHKGYELKNVLIDNLNKAGYKVVDAGDKQLDPNDDFPVFARRAATQILSSDDQEARGIFVCGSGQGMVMAANRIRGIRAGLGWSRESARSIRNDEDANVLALPSELYKQNPQLVFDIVEDFLRTPFANAARFIRRNGELDSM